VRFDHAILDVKNSTFLHKNMQVIKVKLPPSFPPGEGGATNRRPVAD